MLALSGNTFGLNFPQALASVLLALTTTALARRAGYRWDASMFAGLMVPFTHEIGRQTAEAQIDILTAALSASAMLYVVAGIQHYRQQKFENNHALIYLAIAFGLATGTKFTAIFLLPGAAIAFALYALRQLRGGAISALAACFCASVCGFILFGSYNYLLNVASFGNPISSQDVTRSSDLINLGILDETYLETMRDPAANAVRYTYQVVGLEYFAADVAEAFKTSLFRKTFTDWLGIDYTLNGVSITEHTNLRTFILVFPMPLLLSLVIMPILLWQSRGSEDASLRAVYIFIAWGWIATISILATWSGVRIRLFIVIVPFILAAVVPWLYTQRYLRFVWCGVLLFGAVFNVVQQIAVPNPDRALFKTHTEEILMPLVVDAETIGLMGDLVAIYHMMTGLPDDLTYQFVPVDEAENILRRGDPDLIFAEPKYCDETWPGLRRIELNPPYRFMLTCVYQPEPAPDA